MSVRTLLGLVAVLHAPVSGGCGDSEKRAGDPVLGAVDCAQLITADELSKACGAPLAFSPARDREGRGQNVCDREVGAPELKTRLVVMRARDHEAARVMGRAAPENQIVASTVHPSDGYRVEDATVRVGLLVASIRNQVRGDGPSLCSKPALGALATKVAARLGGLRDPGAPAPAARLRITYRLDARAIASGVDVAVALREASDTIRRRSGDLEVEVRGERIVVELAAASEAEIARQKALIATRGHLELKIVVHDSAAMLAFHAAAARDEDGAAARAGIRAATEPWSHQGVLLDDSFLRATTRAALEATAAGLTLEPGRELAYEKTDGGWRTHVVPTAADIDGTSVSSATASRNPGAGAASVLVTFDAAAAARLAALTREHRGKRLAIIVDGEVMTAPVIFATISDGAAQITLGSDATERSAEALATALRAGALPAPLIVESVETISR